MPGRGPNPSIKLEFSGFDEILKKLTKLEADTKTIAEKALTETHKIVTEKAAVAVQKPNLPAQGKYSRKNPPNTASSLKRDVDISWNGTVGSVDVGFDISHGGLPTVFMIRGTPTYMKNQMLYDAFYGDQTIGEIRNRQKEIFYKALEEFEE